MNDINPKRDDNWYKAQDLLANSPKSSNVGLIVVLRRGRGRRPNEDKTTALFNDIAARVTSTTHESPTLLKPFASMQTCLVEGSARWVIEMLNQPEIESAVINNNTLNVSGKSGARRGLPGKTTWCSGLMQH